MTVKSLKIDHLISSNETRLNLSRLVLNNRDKQDEMAKRSNKDRPLVPDLECFSRNGKISVNWTPRHKAPRNLRVKNRKMMPLHLKDFKQNEMIIQNVETVVGRSALIKEKIMIFCASLVLLCRRLF